MKLIGYINRDTACSETWPRDPALEVEYPTRHMLVGMKCRRPSGHPCGLHHSCDQAAMDAGFLQSCPKGPRAQEAHLSSRLSLS
jgi:hypothetical protein